MLVKEFEYKTYQCEIRKNERLGNLCGYVRLKNPKHELANEDVHVDCHGGITFRVTSDDGLMIGFDCAHYNDGIPALHKMFKRPPYPVRDEEYVRGQLKGMVDQIVERWGEQ